MRILAIPLPLLAAVVALAAVPAITPAVAKASRHIHHKHHMHMKKHGWYRTHPHRGAWIGPAAQPMVRYGGPSEPICPGVGHSFDCKIWPPPYADDPDRRTTRF